MLAETPLWSQAVRPLGKKKEQLQGESVFSYGELPNWSRVWNRLNSWDVVCLAFVAFEKSWLYRWLPCLRSFFRVVPDFCAYEEYTVIFIRHKPLQFNENHEQCLGLFSWHRLALNFCANIEILTSINLKFHHIFHVVAFGRLEGQYTSPKRGYKTRTL